MTRWGVELQKDTNLVDHYNSILFWENTNIIIFTIQESSLALYRNFMWHKWLDKQRNYETLQECSLFSIYCWRGDHSPLRSTRRSLTRNKRKTVTRPMRRPAKPSSSQIETLQRGEQSCVHFIVHYLTRPLVDPLSSERLRKYFWVNLYTAISEKNNLLFPYSCKYSVSVKPSVSFHGLEILIIKN